ncbi:UDP-N-acetylglucosamine 2-epimerase [Methanolobus sp. WCC5]|uniref:UDP-N-acetylglucosamine 2-epimerase n=1 Tax=Methanolobus sp. WCC5 TaxID=3125785 RepID=UPI003243FA9F
MTASLKGKDYMVATVHRASNTDNPDNLKTIMSALNETKCNLIFPLHPRTKKSLESSKLYKNIGNHIKFIDPLGYFDMLKLMSNSKKIITDSGGIQKEAYILDIPCVTLRDNTEWIETIEAGSNLLVGTNYNKIVSAINSFEGYKGKKNIYGKGDSSIKICNIIEEYVNSNLL